MENTINYIAVDSISPNLYQPRKVFDEESIQELAQSIKVYGIIQPYQLEK